MEARVATSPVDPRDGASAKKQMHRPDVKDIKRPPMSGSSASRPLESDSPTISNFEDTIAVQQVTPAVADEAERIVGVSISRTQSRMKAHQTPAAEKSRAMEQSSDYFRFAQSSVNLDFDLSLDSEERYLPTLTAEPEALPGSEEQHKDDHPAKKGKRRSLTKSILKSGHSRSWSADSLKKLVPDLSGLTKNKSRSSIARLRPKSVSTIQFSSSRDASDGTGTESEDNSPTVRYMRISTGPSHSSQQSRRLRHAASDESVYLRTLSRTSTLDHRARYEHVHSQVNSRYIAIKDALQDSSNRLLNIPNFSTPDIKVDWRPARFLNDASQNGRNRPAKQSPKDGTPQRPQSRRKSLYPTLSEAMSQMTGDVVIMGGYRGSILRSAKPPHRQLWVPFKVGLNIRKVDLEVGLNPEDEENMEESIIASEVLSHIGPIDICRRLMNQLRKCENAKNGKLRVWDYGYDWRLSPHLLSRRLIKFLEGLPCNAPDMPREKRGAFVIAHSLGGLIARHAVNQRPELFAGVVYAGTPQHAVNILGPLRNGDEVLLSSRVLTAQVNFTFRTSYLLLPEDGRCFVDKHTKEDYLVDFFSVKTWDEYRLSPCISPPLPPMEIDNRRMLPFELVKRFSGILGSRDPTDNLAQPSRFQKGKTEALKGSTVAPTIGGLVGPDTAFNVPKDHSIAAPESTIPREDAIAYLDRTLKEVLQFKRELAFNRTHQDENRYPPFAVLYSKSLPTVYGARVLSREYIKCRDAYDDLVFAAGDGVCLASACMLPPGYRIIKDGLVKTDRGHAGLLGDLEAVGRCLLALVRGRATGVGLGKELSD